MYGSNKLSKIPDIIISDDVYRKINAYADLCNDEISALGSVHIENDNVVIDNIYLFNQVVSGSSTVLSQEDISNFMCDCINKGKDTAVLKFWWHSHVNMQTFWSGTDTNTIERFSSDWMISMVSNKRGEYKVRLDIFSPIRMYFDEVPLIVQCDKAFDDAIRKEIHAKVKQHQFMSGIREFVAPSYHSSPAYADKRIIGNNEVPVHSSRPDYGNVQHSDSLLRSARAIDERNKAMASPDWVGSQRDPVIKAPLNESIDFILTGDEVDVKGNKIPKFKRYCESDFWNWIATMILGTRWDYNNKPYVENSYEKQSVAETKPVEIQPVESDHIEIKPVEIPPVESKPVENLPPGVMSVDDMVFEKKPEIKTIETAPSKWALFRRK